MFEFKVGDLVLLTLESGGFVGMTEGLLKYKGRKFRIKSVHHVQGRSKTNCGVYYELKGCVTKYGVPYAILPSWIQPMRELKR